MKMAPVASSVWLAKKLFLLAIFVLPLYCNCEEIPEDVAPNRFVRQGALTATVTVTLESGPPVYFILTKRPTPAPTDEPTITPMPTITPQPTTLSPTVAPTLSPSLRPTDAPTVSPSHSPSEPPNKVERIGEDFGPGYPLQHCQGDCDNDSDCSGDMVCYTRNAGDLAPGCVGGEELGDGVDVCIFRENNPTPSPTRAPTPYPTFTPGSVPSGTFKLKLYWDNYNWQEEDFERKWCICHHYDRSYCWYGDDSDDCEDDQMYIDECENDRYEQEFEFIDIGGGEVLVKVGSENTCWSRENRRIVLEACNGSSTSQRFIPMNGNFDSYRFEISQRGFESQCVTQDHHPKEREVLEFHSCEGSRKEDTSYWNILN